MSRLQVLKPRLTSLKASRLQVLDAEAGSTPRIRGRKWMSARRRIAERDGFRCRGCGRLWNARIDDVDHRVPLEAGGSNDDANLQLLCVDCHALKTASEAAHRRR